MNDQPPDYEHYRELLIVLRDSLQVLAETGAESAQTVELDQTRVGRLSRMDALQAQAMSQEANRRCAARLRAIASALRRMERDEYGECLDCGEYIDPRRLEADPTVTLCISCAAQADA